MTRPVRITTVSDGRAARRDIGQTATAVDQFGSRSGRSFATAERAAKVASVGLVASVVAIGKSSVDVEAQFSQQMSLIGAATGSSADQLAKLRDLAKEMGAQTSFSANEAAEAMLELSKSGLSPATIQAGALEGTLTLAAAGGTDLATAATVASNAINTFGLEGRDMAKVAAAIAGGANASSASVESLAFGLSQVGPGAKNAGLSLNETVAALSAFDAAGIKGSDAGTSLKTMLSSLVPQNDKAASALEELGVNALDAQGNFRSLEEIAGQLKEGFKGLSDQQRTSALQAAFGSDASRAAIALAAEGEEGIRKYIKATEDQGAAQELAAARTSGTAGALERLSGAAETSKLVIGEALAPVIVDVADYLSERLVPATEKTVEFIKKMVGAAKSFKQGEGSKPLGELGDTLEDIDWDKAIEGAKATASAVATISGAVGAAGIDLFADSLDLTSKALGFVADHSDELAAALPFLAAGFVAVKAAQAAANLATAVAIPLRLAELAASRQQTVAIRAMTAAVAQLTAATAVNNAATQSMIVTQAGTYSAVRQTTASTTAAASSMTRMGLAARGAAGIGGIAALTVGMQSADSATSALTTTLGAAAIGFSLGGPLGAALGAGVGAALTLYRDRAGEAKVATDVAAQAAVDAKADYEGLRGTLDDLTGATTRQTRAFVQDKLARADVLNSFAAQGVEPRTVVNAVLGERAARQQVTEAIRAQKAEVAALDQQVVALAGTYDQSTSLGRLQYNDAKKGLEDQKAAILGTIRAYESQGFTLRSAIADQREAAAAIQDYSALAGRVPPRVITSVEATGIEPTVSGIAKIVRQQRLVDGKQIRALIEVTGVETSVKQIRKYNENIRAAGSAKPDTRKTSEALRRGIQDLEFVAGRGGLRIKKGVEEPVAKTRVNLNGVTTSVRSGLEPGKSAARSGGVGIGANAKFGFSAGFSGADRLWAGQVRRAVNAAIAAGRAAADIRSPSRKTAYIGDMMGAGLERGLARRRPGAKKAGRDYVSAALAGVTLGSSGIDTAIDKARAVIDREIARDLAADKKDVPGARKGRTQATVDREIKALEKLSAARRNKIIKGLADEFAALRRNGKEQDRNAAKLAKARDRYKQLVEESKAYAASIKDSFVGFGNVVSLGQGAGFANSDQLITQLRGRVDAAERFAKIIRQLTSAGLNKTTIQQLLDAGPEAALGTAESIAAGGASAIKEINGLTSDLAAAGTSLGNTMADRFHGAGIQAAAGLVAGLEKEQRKLDAAASRIGAQIVKAIKRELGIRSPSRVFRGVGEDTMAGLALGLDETYARRLGANVGRGVEDGFARPRLTATIGRSPLGGDRTPIRIDLRLRADQVDQLARGKQIQVDLDAYRRAGGRSTS